MLRSLNGILFEVEEARGRRGGLALDSSLSVSQSVSQSVLSKNLIFSIGFGGGAREGPETLCYATFLRKWESGDRHPPPNPRKT